MSKARDRAVHDREARDRAVARKTEAAARQQSGPRGSGSGNDQLRQIGLQTSVRTEDRDQLGGQLRRTPEANDSAND